MNYTPLTNLSDTELLHNVWNKENPTDQEIELAERLDYLIHYVEELEDSLGIPHVKTRTKYAEAA